MSTRIPERPKLRPFLRGIQDPRDPVHVYVMDRLMVSQQPERFTWQEFQWLDFFDGSRTLRDIQGEAVLQAGGRLVPLETFAVLARRLEEALFLEGPRFREIVHHPVRPPRCIGCYQGEPRLLRMQLDRLFTGPGGPGLPQKMGRDGELRAALIPHIDYQRGGVSYAWGFKEVFEKTAAALFVVIGTSHHSTHRYTITRKNFQTPLGIAATDQRYIDRLVHHFGVSSGDPLFEDELLAHLPEHSIELEVVFLQYLYEGKRPIRIVPIVVGSFHDCIWTGEDPARKPDIAQLIESLRKVEAEWPEPICYIISGDLAHIGPKFEPNSPPLEEPTLAHSRQWDMAILQRAEQADPAGYFQVIASESDRRNICGLPPTYSVLEAFRPSRGKVLHYDQYVHPQGFESVSFASVAFYK